MGTKTAEVVEKDPDQQFAAAKEAFEQAKRRTALEAGLVESVKKAEEKAPEPIPEPAKAEKAEEKPVEDKPAPKPKAKPKAAPKPAAAAPDPLATVTAQLKALEDRIASLTAPRQEPEPEVDPLEAHKAKLVERFGEEEAAALMEYADARISAAEARAQRLEQIINEATTHGRKQLAKANRKRLAESFPHLQESDDAWEMLNTIVASTIEKEPKKYGSIEDAYDDVASKLYGYTQASDESEDEDELSEEDEKEASRIAASAMTAPDKSGNKERRSREDKMREHFEFLKKHPEDKAGAKRLARELGIDR